jgi:hypothetical protein
VVDVEAHPVGHPVGHYRNHQQQENNFSKMLLTLYTVFVPVRQQGSVVKGGQLAVTVVRSRHIRFVQVLELKVHVPEGGAPLIVVT